MAVQPKPDKKTSPKGIGPKTGKAYGPAKREDWDKLLKRAARSRER